MGTLGGEIDLIEIVEERADLFSFELAVGADDAMARDRRQALFEIGVEFAARADFADLGDHTADRLAVVPGGKKRRRRSDDVFSRAAERLDGEANAFEEVEPLLQ